MIAILALLYLLAFVCFVLATFGVGARVNLIALGLACAAGAWLLAIYPRV